MSGTGVTGTTPSGAGSGSPHSGVTGTRPTKDASATRLAETGVDAASALPAAGVLGLLGALGLLLGRRRRGNRTAG
jgi:LPXTG-motif cell wall-anchored protein